MDLKTLGLLDAEIADLRNLSRHREWTTVLKLVEEAAKFYAKEALDPKRSDNLDKINLARGKHEGCLKVYRWLRHLYDESHGDKVNERTEA